MILKLWELLGGVKAGRILVRLLKYNFSNYGEDSSEGFFNRILMANGDGFLRVF